ncbi:RHA1A [Symbiodinium natans]|uniref:RHA1A protein n=1 Tax=Symbiodinium natans TaxID=878477 RepID=A0A812QSP0_9DINO|nr:RHA1A [Symbiodinium natans]
MRRRMAALAFVFFLSSWVVSWTSSDAGEKTILLCFEWYAIVLLAVGVHLDQRRRRDPPKEGPKEVSCVWAPCRFDLRQSSPEFHSFEVKSGDPVSWTSHGPTPLVAPSLVGDLQTCLCCLDDFDPDSKVAILPCGHIFHQECVAAWSVLQVHSNCRCPTCSHSFLAPHACV